MMAAPLLLLPILFTAPAFAADEPAGPATAATSEALVAALAAGRQDVALAPGTYVVGPDALVVPADTRIRGASRATVVRAAEGTAVLMRLGEGVTLSDFVVDGASIAEGGVTDAVIELGDPADRCVISSVAFRDCNRACIVTDHADGLTVRGCEFSNVGVAISLQFCDDFLIDGNRVDGARLHGIQFWGNWKWETKDISDAIITGNRVTNGGAGAIWGTGAQRVVVANNIVDGAEDVGIDLEWCDHASITGNVVRNCKNAGISLFFSCHDLAISGNTILNDYPIDDPDAEWWVRAGIWLTYPNRGQFPNDDGHRNVAITGNLITSAEGRRRAMWIGADSGNVHVSDNTVSDGAIWLGGGEKEMRQVAQPFATDLTGEPIPNGAREGDAR